ncbi:sigma-70 family RNA polymerase sigma factor [Longibacter salinarum]|nr:sigma-70 family RNA polymerase sigma factor [Longibacter salinarum]
MSDKSRDVTELLQLLGGGDVDALDDLMKAVYDQLRRIAHNQLHGERHDHPFQTTELVHEAYEKLVDHHAVEWKDRQHFYAVAARAMRQVLVDVARRRTADKRGGSRTRIDLEQATLRDDLGPEDVVLVDDLLNRLAEQDERMAKVVECRFFGGYTIAETADVLGVSSSTVNRDWRTARAWLNREMDAHASGKPTSRDANSGSATRHG